MHSGTSTHSPTAYNGPQSTLVQQGGFDSKMGQHSLLNHKREQKKILLKETETVIIGKSSLLQKAYATEHYLIRPSGTFR